MSLFLCHRQEIAQSMSSKPDLRYLTMPMAVFGVCESRAFTPVEGALSQRLIAWLAEGSDHCGHDKGGRPHGESKPSAGPPRVPCTAIPFSGIATAARASKR
ncbi:hypothetical protein [Cupriavidus pinatubonensis]|uniref:hypothetical protein n=1 Tax=Cupriavidus pinatubonensis TaxID=248026 RepID=UPI001CC686A2|nr:hypothetical protein [Cupriavidus pinatubonensis]